MCALVVLQKFDRVALVVVKRFRMTGLHDSYVAGTNQMSVNKSVTRIWN